MFQYMLSSNWLSSTKILTNDSGRHKMTNIPCKILQKVEYVAKYIETSSDDWFRVKKELLATCAPKERAFFSRRHKTSKKHFLNDFELELIKTWKQLTGVELKVDPAKLHTPEDERPPRYWALMQLNKKRQEAANDKS